MAGSLLSCLLWRSPKDRPVCRIPACTKASSIYPSMCATRLVQLPIARHPHADEHVEAEHAPKYLPTYIDTRGSALRARNDWRARQVAQVPACHALSSAYRSPDPAARQRTLDEDRRDGQNKSRRARGGRREEGAASSSPSPLPLPWGARHNLQPRPIAAHRAESLQASHPLRGHRPTSESDGICGRCGAKHAPGKASPPSSSGG